jgi:hypothetical protein
VIKYHRSQCFDKNQILNLSAAEFTNTRFSRRYKYWRKHLRSIRNNCIRDFKSSLKTFSNFLYSYCVAEKKLHLLDREETCVLFDIYIKKKCPHFEILLELVIETCNVNHLVSNVALENTAEKSNADCISHILSELDRDDILNFVCTYWNRRNI